MRQTNQAGIDLIKSFEGLRLDAYLCPAGIPTIGYGHTGNVSLGDRITEDQAEEILRKDLEKFEKGVESLISVNITDNQFAALVSFAFNVGLGNLSTSTLRKMINQGYGRAAADQFLRWNKAGGRVLDGLVRRRHAERELFLA